MSEDYEILPKDEIDDLRHEVEKIKKDPFGEHEKNKTLLDSMDALTEAINKLLYLFEKTQKELIDEYELNKPNEMLQDVLDQNEKIAKGTLAVADLVKSQKKDIDELKSNFNAANKNSVSSNNSAQNSNLPPQNQSKFGSTNFSQNANSNQNNNSNSSGAYNEGNSFNANNNNNASFSEMPPLPPVKNNKKRKKFF